MIEALVGLSKTLHFKMLQRCIVMSTSLDLTHYICECTNKCFITYGSRIYNNDSDYDQDESDYDHCNILTFFV